MSVTTHIDSSSPVVNGLDHSSVLRSGTAPRHLQALAYAKAGIAVFPCLANGKAPATPRGFKDRTTDEAQINAWFAVADYNIAIVPEDAALCVVDVDPKNGGNETWAALCEKHGEPPATRIVRTPSGGFHIYFRGSLPSTAGRLGPGLDTRGRVSYVVVPPSYVIDREKGYEGPYTVESNLEFADLPAWISDALERAPVELRQAPENVVLDDPVTKAWAVERIAEEIRDNGPPVDGAKSDDRAYRLITKLRDGDRPGYSLAQETVVELLLEHWAPHFDRWWIEQKVDSPYRGNVQNPAGAGPIDCTERKFDLEALKTFIDQWDAEHPGAAAEREARIMAAANQNAEPLVDVGFLSFASAVAYSEPLVDWWWQDRFVLAFPNLFTGRAKAGKTTFLENLIAHSVASAPFFGAATRPVDVIMLAGEDRLSTVRDNLLEIAQAIGVDPDLIHRRVFLRSVVSHPVSHGSGHWLANVDDDGKIVTLPFWNEVVAPALAARQTPVVFIADPLTEFVHFNRYSDMSARAMVTRFLGPMTRMGAGVTPLFTDHPSITAVREGRDVGGSVQMEASFANVATLKAGDWVNGQRKMTFETKFNRYAPEDEKVEFYLVKGSRAFVKDGAPGHTAQDREHAVYRHVAERLERREYTAKTNRSEYGPGEIAYYLTLPEGDVKAALFALAKKRWLQYEDASGGRDGARAHYEIGPDGPKLRDLRCQDAEPPAGSNPW